MIDLVNEIKKIKKILGTVKFGVRDVREILNNKSN